MQRCCDIEDIICHIKSVLCILERLAACGMSEKLRTLSLLLKEIMKTLICSCERLDGNTFNLVAGLLWISIDIYQYISSRKREEKKKKKQKKKVTAGSRGFCRTINGITRLTNEAGINYASSLGFYEILYGGRCRTVCQYAGQTDAKSCEQLYSWLEWKEDSDTTLSEDVPVLRSCCQWGQSTVGT